jgi:hypothetical protein
MSAPRHHLPNRTTRRGQALHVLLALTLTVGLAVGLTASGSSGDQTQATFRATADGQLDSTHASKAYGHLTSLRVDGSPAQQSLLRFVITGAHDITHVSLRLWAESPGSGRASVRPVTTTWDERTTWAGRPTVGAPIGMLAKHPKQEWVTVDLTDHLTSGGTIDLALTSTASTAERYASREAGAHGPQLVVTAVNSTHPQPTGPAVGEPVQAPLRDDNGPVRAAFYYPWFPESWNQQGYRPFSVFHPSAGYYDSSATATLDRSLDDLRYAGMDTVISSWQGPGSLTDKRLPTLLTHAAAKGLRVSAYYEREGTDNPSVSQIHADLVRLVASATTSPAYLRRGGRPVVFVYSDPRDGCDMARRWKQANDLGLYVVLKIFPGYTACDAQPQGWHQYSPALRSVAVGTDSVSVSPGFWKKGERSRLPRDVKAFDAAVAAMATSGATFQLVTTYNEWGEGTSVESATEWASTGGRGAYLEVLHRRLGLDPTVAAAGDIACTPKDRNFNAGRGSTGNCKQRGTSDLLLALNPTAVLPLGDTQYECGDAKDFQTSYGATWGRLKDRTRPAIGNHEYARACNRNDASGYFDYFGAQAGPRNQGWYSYDLGTWHLIALNSECTYGTGTSAVGGCDAGSPQETWLRNDLATHPARCTLAYWHEPRWSSGQHGDAQQMSTLWNDLVAAHADVVLSGHNHNYERFGLLGASPQDGSASRASTTTGAPSFQDPTPDPLGVREFVVGTGGKNHYGFARPPLIGEQSRDPSTYGVLSLTLHPTGYDWRFVKEAGTFTDAGSDSCH